MVDLFQTSGRREDSQGVSLEPGQLVKKRYLVQAAIGSGASATVYRAIDTHLGSLAVALKVFTPNFVRSTHFQNFYANELQTSFKVDHENVVRLYDMIRSKGLIAIVNEFIDGITLDQLVANWGGRLKAPVVKEVILQVVRGLEAIHDRGIIHHDLKPENILVAANGFVKISDFGVSKGCMPTSSKADAPRGKRDTAQANLAGHKQLTGTPYYASPEYLSGAAPSIQQDLYAVGIMLHELLHGQPLFDTTSLANFIDSKLEYTIPPLLSIFPDCPMALAAIVDRLLEPDIDKRYKSAREVKQALEKINLPNPGIALKPVKQRLRKKKSWYAKVVINVSDWCQKLGQGLVSMLIGIPLIILAGITKFFKTFFTSSVVLYPIAAVVVYLVLTQSGLWSAIAKIFPH